MNATSLFGVQRSRARVAADACCMSPSASVQPTIQISLSIVIVMDAMQSFGLLKAVAGLKQTSSENSLRP